MSDDGKYVYAFGGGSAEGGGDLKPLLGGKGAGLAEMSRLGIPVPPGFTITTRACIYYQQHDKRYPEGLREQVAAALAALETHLGRRFGDPANPLLMSVRSGAPASMPGMMDTVLNLGLTDAVVAAGDGASARFLRDAYRRLLTMYGDVVLGVPRERFEAVLAAARERQEAATDAELSAAELERVVEEMKAVIAAVVGEPFPQDPGRQLWGGIAAVFDSWNNRRAREYRRLHGLPDDWGTAVNVQAMVFGNRGADCATGVAFSRNPATGEPGLYGEYLVNAQGEDVVAGIRTPRAIAPRDGQPGGLREDFPAAQAELERISARLERHFRDLQDVEFTIEGGHLYLLQTRTGKRTGPAAVRIAVDLVDEGLIDEAEALRRVRPEHLEQLLAPVFDLVEKERAVAAGQLLATGLPAGPGAASGRIAFDADRAVEMARSGPVLLVREETSPEDIVGMHVAAGILTSRGGMTSHAAVVARGMGRPCVVGAGELHVDEGAGVLRVQDKSFAEGEFLSLDGTTGQVLGGRLATRPSEVLEGLRTGAPPSPSARVFTRLLEMADRARRLEVRANADTPTDAANARAFGAQGIGLCRTEHMFFAEDRIPWVRRMILAADATERKTALAHLLPVQQGDFEGILAAMDGLPVTIRLLDPPLHEFLPHTHEAQAGLAREMGVAPQRVRELVEELSEQNPMLGHRGCRLGITAPEIYDMQVEAIARAACARKKAGGNPRPEVMIPLVGVTAELERLRRRVAMVLERVLAEEGMTLPVPIGTMIEVPRAALAAGPIAAHADFFSFGTNDLTQMTYGYSRDDAGRFLPAYLEQGILPADPFARLDREGVGELVRLACERGCTTNPHLHLGVCGEHGGDPSSVEFFHRVGLDYVSCSPFRVPIARLAAAKAALGEGADTTA
jgi:pyruvate,orthophosphate dikinase